MRNVYQNYLRDLGNLIREAAALAKREKEGLNDSSQRDYATGRLMAYHEVVSLMQSQASAFEIPLADIGLDSMDPDRDLL